MFFLQNPHSETVWDHAIVFGFCLPNHPPHTIVAHHRFVTEYVFTESPTSRRVFTESPIPQVCVASVVVLDCSVTAFSSHSQRATHDRETYKTQAHARTTCCTQVTTLGTSKRTCEQVECQNKDEQPADLKQSTQAIIPTRRKVKPQSTAQTWTLGVPGVHTET